ncbi:MAG: glycosyltransferase family 2 protein [Paludibacteraceae bacterium]|nr:glycosyltransferase family 2 protein [Paludibacteraceae bacterium]
MDKILSIIIATYNMEGLLSRCLESLLLSSEFHKLYEVIVVNDGSTDNSSKVGHQFADSYPDVFRVIDKTNGNYGSCINVGLSEAKGKYIKILDADDWFDTSEFQNLLTYLNCNEDVDLVITNYTKVLKDGTSVVDVKGSYLEYNKVYDESVMGIGRFKYMAMHAITYNKRVFKGLDYKQTEGVSYTDQEWILYPMENIHSIVYLNFNVYQYLLDRVGQTMDEKQFQKSIGHFSPIIQKMLEKFNSINTLSSPFVDYYKFRLSCVCESVYRMVLLMQSNKSYQNSSELLKKLDETILKSSLEYYKIMDTFIIRNSMPLCYVKYWRQNNKRYSWFILVLNKLLNCIKGN